MPNHGQTSLASNYTRDLSEMPQPFIPVKMVSCRFAVWEFSWFFSTKVIHLLSSWSMKIRLMLPFTLSQGHLIPLCRFFTSTDAGIEAEVISLRKSHGSQWKFIDHLPYTVHRERNPTRRRVRNVIFASCFFLDIEIGIFNFSFWYKGIISAEFAYMMRKNDGFTQGSVLVGSSVTVPADGLIYCNWMGG